MLDDEHPAADGDESSRPNDDNNTAVFVFENCKITHSKAFQVIASNIFTLSCYFSAVFIYIFIAV